MSPEYPSKPDPLTSHQLFNLPLLYHRCCLQGRFRPIVNVCMPAEPPSPPQRTCWLHNDLVPLHPHTAPRRSDGTAVGLAQRSAVEEDSPELWGQMRWRQHRLRPVELLSGGRVQHLVASTNRWTLEMSLGRKKTASVCSYIFFMSLLSHMKNFVIWVSRFSLMQTIFAPACMSFFKLWKCFSDHFVSVFFFPLVSVLLVPLKWTIDCMLCFSNKIK